MSRGPGTGIGARQAAVLTLLWVAASHPMQDEVLAAVASTRGYVTEGRKSIDSLHRRGFVKHVSGAAGRTVITAEGLRALARWLRTHHPDTHFTQEDQ